MTPISIDGAITIPIAIVSKALQTEMGSTIQLIVTAIVVLMAIASVLTKVINPQFIRKNHFLRTLLKVNLFWLTTRVLGAIFIVMVYLQIGPEAIT
ncbi:MAG: YjiH family protein, partial [Shewanella sp.]